MPCVAAAFAPTACRSAIRQAVFSCLVDLCLSYRSPPKAGWRGKCQGPAHASRCDGASAINETKCCMVPLAGLVTGITTTIRSSISQQGARSTRTGPDMAYSEIRKDESQDRGCVATVRPGCYAVKRKPRRVAGLQSRSPGSSSRILQGTLPSARLLP